VTSGIGGGGAIGVSQISSDSQNATPLTSPVRINAKIHSGVSGLVGRKRNGAGAGLDSSPGSIDDLDDVDQERKRQPVKRACNECRQQKVCLFLVVTVYCEFLLIHL
jgi:hypothetical protein